MFAMNTQKPERYLTVKDIVEEYGLSRIGVQRLLKKGVVRGTLKFNNRGGYRVPESAWREYVEQHHSVKPNEDA